MGDSSVGGSVCNGWEVARRNPPAVDERFFEGMNSQRWICGLSKKTEWYKMFGCAISEWYIFRSGCFQAWDCNNKSVNPFRSRSQVTSALSDPRKAGQRVRLVFFGGGIVLSAVDKGRSNG